MKTTLITNDNFRYFADHPKHVAGCRPRVTAYNTWHLAKAVEERLPLVPRKDWPDIIARKDAEKSWLSDVLKLGEPEQIVPTQDQDGLGYCHGYGTVKPLMVARVLAGLPHVELCPESIAGPVTGWRNEGADPEEDLQQAIKFGACDMSFQDAPNSINPRRWKPGWQEEALNHRAEEVWDTDVPGKVADAIVTCSFVDVLCGVGYGWWGHFIAGPVKVYIAGSRVSAGFGGAVRRQIFRGIYWNSWGDSEEFPDMDVDGKGEPDIGSFAPRVTTQSEG